VRIMLRGSTTLKTAVGNVNPDVTRLGEVIFTVAPDASAFKLQVGDTNPFTDKNGYVGLGF
jgi:hypothetical protein